ncbi:MAG TPA: tripartite tricarboxylate transporter TctB family protein [Egibacteraceae bacterium]
MKRLDQATTVGIIVLTLAYLVVASSYPTEARVIPMIVGTVTLVLATVQLLGARVAALKPFVGEFKPVEEAEIFSTPAMRRRLLIVCATLLALPLLIVVLGIVVALPVYVALFTAFLGRQPWWVVAVCTAAMTGVAYGLLVVLLGMPWNDGRLWALF